MSSDLRLYIEHLIREHQQFTYLELNRRMNQFRYLGDDSTNKPCELNPDGNKLGGHAVQNWCLLRIEGPANNKVQQLVLQLREIVELICAIPTV